MQTTKKNAGFTLVELAIVLVIIGLLVGGVLVGQDLIKAAEIRAVSSDLQKYDTGAAAFRTKYSGIPGDLVNTKCNSFFSGTGICGAGTDGLGDGDGILESGATDKAGFAGENNLFWRHLSEAQFIPFGSTGTATVAGGIAAADLDPLAPKLRIRDIAYVHASGLVGLNYYFLANFNNSGSTAAVPNLSAALSPREAVGVDQKIDDGNAVRGVVLGVADASGTPITITNATTAAGGADGSAMSGLSAGTCYNTGVTTASLAGSYNTGTEGNANALGCALRIRAQF